MAGRARRPFNPGTSPQKNTGIRVPKVVVDPVSSLKPWPTVVTVGGSEYEIPALSAADWLSVLMADPLNLDMMFLELAPHLAEAVDDALMDEILDFDQYLTLIQDVISAVAGRPWFKALRLIGSMAQSWDVVGAELELRGVDTARISLGAWLDIALITMLKLMDEKEVAMFTLKLEAPPPGQEQQELEMSTDDFQALMRNQ